MAEKRVPTKLIDRYKKDNPGQGARQLLVWVTDLGEMSTKEIAQAFGVSHGQISKVYARHGKQLFDKLANPGNPWGEESNATEEWNRLGRLRRQPSKPRPLTFVEILNREEAR